MPGKEAQHRAKCDTECTRIRPLLVDVLDQQRDLERPALRRRQLRQHLLDDAVEQIRQSGERQLLLGLGGPRSQHSQPLLAGGLHPCQPEGRLANSGVACENECTRPLARPLDEGVERRQLFVPADDFPRRHEGSTRASSVLERIPSFA